jgi:hypothetical protein
MPELKFIVQTSADLRVAQVKRGAAARLEARFMV